MIDEFNETPPVPSDDEIDVSGEVDYSKDVVGPPVFSRPVIKITPDIPTVVDACEDALLKAGGIYQRAGFLVRIIEAPEKVARIERAVGSAIIGQIESASLTESIARVAKVEKYDARSGKWVHGLPAGWMATTLSARGSWSFPALRGIVTAPTLRASGEVLDQPGYDHETGLHLIHREKWPRVGDRPTLDRARVAMDFLFEAIADFPFSAPFGRSAAISAILTIAARVAIPEPVPLFVIGARDAATGKTLLANVISTIGTGSVAPTITPWDNPEEGRKTMLALAIAGDPVGLIDNYPTTRGLGDEALDAALTSGIVRGRVLGETRMINVPWETVLFVTGNNISFAGDTASRSISIDMDAQVENPEERTGFKHDPILPWVQKERKKLVIAALTVLRAYHFAGRPSQGLSRMRFNAWSDLVRSAIVWTGQTDPCEGRKEIREQGDPTREALCTLLRRWYETWGGAWKSVADIRIAMKEARSPELLDLDEAFKDLVKTEKDGQVSARSLGKMLARHKGQHRGGFVLIRSDATTGSANHTAFWRVSTSGVSGVSGVSSLPHVETVRSDENRQTTIDCFGNEAP